jgi:hypothetical protein
MYIALSSRYRSERSGPQCDSPFQKNYRAINLIAFYTVLKLYTSFLSILYALEPDLAPKVIFFMIGQVKSPKSQSHDLDFF